MGNLGVGAVVASFRYPALAFCLPYTNDHFNGNTNTAYKTWVWSAKPAAS
jgi:hypothetical protein